MFIVQRMRERINELETAATALPPLIDMSTTTSGDKYTCICTSL